MTAATGTPAGLADLCERVLDLVGGRAQAQVTAVATRLGLTRFANSAIHQHVAEDTITVSLKVALEGKVASVDTTRAAAEGLRRLVEGALTAAAVRPIDPDWPGLAPVQPVRDIEHFDPHVRDADPVERASHVAAFVETGPGMQAAGFVDTDASEVAFANSCDHRAGGRATRATIDGIHQTATSAGAGHQTSNRLADLNGAEVGRIAAQLARDGQDPIVFDPGRYEVVLGPEAVGTIAVFLAFYGFNAREYLEGRSFVRLGERQLSDNVSIVDDATDPRAIGLPLDAEGTAKGPLTLVDAGRSANLTHDRRTAMRAGVASTGHAMSGGEAFGAVATNLFVQPGGDGDLQDLIGGVQRGILVTQFHYCRVLDPKTQVVTGLTRNGTFLIERGELSRPVSNLRFTQSFLDALSPGRVLGVGSRLRFADTEFGPGMVVAPPMRLAEWRFTGGARG